MNFYLDCEFNGFGGELISMALVADNGDEWYQVLECKKPVKFVKDNIIPHLNKKSVTYSRFQDSLKAFLKPYFSVHIYANWPEDLIHFLKSTITGQGKCMDIPNLTFEMVDGMTGSGESEFRHNALVDARYFKKKHILLIKNEKNG
jgi:hypothetical protein